MNRLSSKRVIPGRFGCRVWLRMICATGLLLAMSVSAQQPQPGPPPDRLTVILVDENGVAVPGAQLVLSGTQHTYRCETDFAGRCNFLSLPPGSYSLDVSKRGFYRLDTSLRFPATTAMDVTLTHEQEIRETVNVLGSPPTIDPQRTSRAETLTSRDILNVPFPTSRDIRNALPLLPEVVMDMSGQIHVAGAARLETLNLMDGFDISQPAPGFMEMRANTDSIRAIDVDTGRYSVQYGHGTNILGLNTGMGDDRFRFTATNFVPSFQNRKGLHFNQWVPRATISGPIKRGKIWFYEAPEAEYDQTIIPELPAGQDRATSWRTGNLTKFQANVAQSDILTTEFLINNLHAPNSGLTAFAPLPSTINTRGQAFLAAIKDQHYFRSGTLLEFGFADIDYSGSAHPQGNEPYALIPEGARGSYYANTDGSSRRLQWITNAFLAEKHWLGQHEIQTGLEFDRVNYHRLFDRAPVDILREDGTLDRRLVFTPTANARESNFQGGFYVQDRWAPRQRLLISGGVRLDWDEIVRTPAFGPRVAATYLLRENGSTKFSAGVGVFYSDSDLESLSRARAGTRLDYFFAPDGVTLLGSPVQTRFLVNDDVLRQPRFVDFSAGLEQKLPGAVYIRAEYIGKRGRNGLTFVNTAGPSQLLGDFTLINARQDHYDALQLTARHTFRELYPIMVSYTRSSARSNTLIDYSVDNVALGTQQGGPVPWDAPNRVVAWGWSPFVKKFMLGYAVEWHNGFPFTIVNESQQIVGRPDSIRFPAYFTLTASLERRFHVFGIDLALRGTVENLTGRQNPDAVNNNISSPHFLTFSGLGHRAFSARIRFLGRSGKGKQPPRQQQPNGHP